MVGLFLVATGQRKFLIMAVDYFSKWVEIEPLAKIIENKVMKFLWKNIYCRYEVSFLDNRTQFSGAKIQAWCEEMKIRQRFIFMIHPQANGQVDVTNRTIVNKIKAKLDRVEGGRADELDLVLWAYRTSPRKSSVELPFNLVCKSEAVIPVEIGMKMHKILKYDKNQNLALLRENLDMMHELKENTYVRMEKYKSYIRANYSRKVKNRGF